MLGQVIWITGLSGSGKTTVAGELCQRFNDSGLKPILLDGDILRDIFQKNDTQIAYSRKERIKLSYKYALLCKTLSSQGFTIVIATVSMFKEIYSWNRLNLPNYFEVYLDVPFDELFRRDPKNIYKKFKAGTINNVAGLDLKVDLPKKAHLVLNYREGRTKTEIVDIIQTEIVKRDKNENKLGLH